MMAAMLRAALLVLLPVVATILAGGGDAAREAAFDAAFDGITEADLAADLAVLAGPAAEGRDSPSAGLDLAAEHIAARLAAAGFTGAGPDGAFRLPFTRNLPAPVESECRLALEGDASAEAFVLGTDFVPVWQANGQASGPLVLLGFGIDSESEPYDDVTGELEGVIALIADGEPRHKKRFEGPELSADADLYRKLATLRDAGVAGVLIVRRPPEVPESKPARKKSGAAAADAPAAPAAPALGFRHTWAAWNDGSPPSDPGPAGIPALELSAAAAERLAGQDVIARLAEVDKSAKPPKPIVTERRVSFAASSARGTVTIANVAGLLAGSDPALAGEYVVIGAHYDHVGVDTRGRVGLGADDNGSGTAALLELAAALGAARPRRSILACAFAAEEDGLLGSDHLAENPPVPREALVAMVNLDMLGFGDADEVAVIGVPENPALGKLLERARKLRPTKVKEVVTGQGQEVFQRSDHYSFHKRGVPSLFFFEGLPVGRNPHYHTWRDTLDTVDVDKIARTTRLVFNTLWLLAEDDGRPPPPEHSR